MDERKDEMGIRGMHEGRMRIGEQRGCRIKNGEGG